MKHSGVTGYVRVGYPTFGSRQAGNNQYRLLDITQFSSKVADNMLAIDWDAPENVSSICERVDLLLQGVQDKTLLP